MFRRILALLSLLLAPCLLAQEVTREQFRAEFSKGLEFGDEKMMDKALKKDGAPQHAVLYFEELYVQKQASTDDAASKDVNSKVEALRASWERCFPKNQTLEKLQRWISGMGSSTYATLQKGRSSSAKLWAFALEMFKAQVKAEYVKTMQQFVELARNAESLGHAIEAAELWGLASVVGNKIPEKTIEDRREALFATEQFVLQRQAWDFTVDSIYVKSHEFAKAEKVRLEEAAKAGEKRKAEGYDPNAKGIDSLVTAGVAEVKQTLQFEALAGWENELDYGPKGGPVPAFWWNQSLGAEGSNRKFDWFRRRDIYLLRTAASKFGIAFSPDDPKKAVEVEASGKPKTSLFWLDNDKKVPYAMFFWAGGERERVGEAEPNLMATPDVANLYYRSAASWKTTLGGEPAVFYDDNCNGTPCDSDPFEPPFRVHTLGEHSGDGTSVPLLDSMRLGKGPRVPYSEFVHLPTGWFHMRRGGVEDVGLRPLNPEYFKTGKVKLVWNGPKPTAPAQLVVQGAGDYKTAFFELAGGKEVDVPAGSYTVVFGRLVVGKGARAQTATIYQGKAQPFVVEPGKTFELKMGAPFTIQFERRGDDNATVDALKILLHEASGCVFTDLHGGLALVPEVLAAKAEDGKGAKVVGKFVRFTDGDLLNQAAKSHGNLGLLCACFPMPEGYKSGEMVLKVKMPGPGQKMGLSMKKHPLFGAIGSAFQ